MLSLSEKTAASAAPSNAAEQRDDYECAMEMLYSDAVNGNGVFDMHPSKMLQLSNCVKASASASASEAYMPPVSVYQLNAHANKDSIWIADLYSSISVHITLKEELQFEPPEWMVGGCNRYMFSARLEHLCTGVIVGQSDDYIKFEYTLNYFDFYSSGCKNKLTVSLHQDGVQPGEVYVIVVIAHVGCDRHSEIYELVGKTNPITVKRFSLCIEEYFDNNPYVHEKDCHPSKLDYFWYNSCGGEFSGLDVMIHLRNETGQLCSADSLLIILGGAQDYDISKAIIEVEADLVYADDESGVPCMQLKPTKCSKKGLSIARPIFRNMRPVPIKFFLGDSSKPFSFRIEEVSKNHQNRGFKLRVKPIGSAASDVCSYIMWETIFVLSKPRNDRRSGTKKEPKSMKLSSPYFLCEKHVS